MDGETAFQPGQLSWAALPAAVEETHVSVVFLVGDRAFKLKKPIELPFLDWRSREARRDVCRREVDLNRRICPDVYLGVADVLNEDGAPCDHLVVMRRMPDDRRLSRLVRERAALRASLDQLAALVASFHARADRSAATIEAAGRDAVLRNWEDNLTTLHAFSGEILDADTVARADALAHDYLAGRGALFEERGRTGHAVDGHGDLLADDIYLLDDGPRVLDCLEFSDRLRAVDVLDDVAFLAMDLERLGAVELAANFLTSYSAHSGESHPVSLAHHYIAYRAGVRSKVACVRTDQGVPAAADEARHLLSLASSHLEVGRVRLVLVGGLPGTGKSTLAAALADRTGWRMLSSDVIRKELLGVAPATRLAAKYGEGIYQPEHIVATYRELLARARHFLGHGESVVLDASWTDVRWRREAAEVARATASELVALRCYAPTDIAARRLIARDLHEASDATPGIAVAMASAAAPWPEAAAVDTSCTIEESVANARRVIGPSDPM
jgi:aminoglycoside phosphotransferase family enzyme/predicted kinase